MNTQIGARVVVAVLSAAVVAIAASCADSVSPTHPLAQNGHVHIAPSRSGATVAGLGEKLADLRRAIVHYHDFATAQREGYSVQVTGCMQDATRGGMGYHYAKADLIDGAVIEARPEVLLYEPAGEGRMKLVGVEFIIPFAAWSAAEPPALYGQTFARNETFQVWALHVWTWRENPAGVFADWNPKVSCARDDT